MKMGKHLFLSFLILILGSGMIFASGSQDADDAATVLERSDTLEINFAMGNNARTMTYQKSDPLTLPDGTIVSQGDLKPTWQYIQGAIGIDIIDVTVQNQKATEMIDIGAASAFGEATIYGGNSIAEDLMNYGAQGYFVNLRDYLDLMPNFKAYLEANENVAKAITAYDGGIYHIPYVAEIGNYARTYNGRADWVIALLDSTSALETETQTLSVEYDGYWDRFDNNVIALQNAAAVNGELSQSAALMVLKDYIAETHPDLAKPSDLYLGATAVYDIDELVALWRVVALSPRTLSKISTGSIVEDAVISPYFVRKSKYREDVLRLMNYFDGQKVHASDSYGALLYIDEDGEMEYSYADEEFLEKLDYIKAWYSEGLINSEFALLSVTDEFRKSMFFADSAEGQRQFGFMTFDWIASTTAGSPKITGFLPPVTTITGAGITDFVHFIENTRAIKPDGWSISAKAAEADRNAAFVLFDYMFSEEGNNVQNYSIPDAWVPGEVFVGPDGTEYPMFNQWILDTAMEFKNGDISGFLRDFMGSHLALGYQKEIGFELQYTSSNGFAAWQLYSDANVLTDSYEAEDPYLRLMPPIISLNEQQVAKLNTVAVGLEQTEAIFKYIVDPDSAEKNAIELLPQFRDAGIETYIDVYSQAYDTMMSGN